jgi:hypothetical protein
LFFLVYVFLFGFVVLEIFVVLERGSLLLVVEDGLRHGVVDAVICRQVDSLPLTAAAIGTTCV